MMPEKRKTLVILSPGFPENEADSTCIPPQQVFVKALKELDPELNIVVLTFTYPFFSAEYDWHGVKVISFGNLNGGRLYRLLSRRRVKLALRKLHKEQQIIGLLSFWLGKCACIGDAFASKHQLPHYSWILGQDAKAGNKYAAKMKLKPGKLIALSDFIAREFHKNYGVLPGQIIPVGIDTALFGSHEVERDIDILGAGSLIPLKRYHLFLEIINAIKVFYPDIKAVICGGGPEKGRLLAMMDDLDLQKNVSLAGILPHADVLGLMRRSKILLHTSEYEGFGAVCLEALYAGAQVCSFVKPMDADITNWQIAWDKEHMLTLLQSVLSKPQTDHGPVLPYTIQQNAMQMLRLFAR